MKYAASGLCLVSLEVNLLCKVQQNRIVVVGVCLLLYVCQTWRQQHPLLIIYLLTLNHS